MKPASRLQKRRPAPGPVAIAILAGGLSTRMGRDKARLRFGRRTLLGHVRVAAEATGWPVRVIRKDLVPRCGPLGGIYTVLKSTRAGVVLFLACDMPFVTPVLMAKIVRELGRRRRAVFAEWNGTAGFPFVIRADALPVIEQQLAIKAYSLQRLAAALKARRVRVPKFRQHELQNINTPEEWIECRKRAEAPASSPDLDVRMS